ncbi:MAG: hypothetical protein MJ010_00835 [Paludibacteraceae bacterium]|nr:hypothetical protein [Paludibacteraceae bacterium]
MKDKIFIVCGSATSWVVDNLINNHGGLYGRLTYSTPDLWASGHHYACRKTS